MRASSGDSNPGGAFALALLIPIVGVILGLVKAFDPDPDQKRLAGLNFAGAVAGVFAYIMLSVWVLPILGYGAGAPAYNEGVMAYQAGNMMQAETHFREAVKTDPNWAAAWVNLAAAQLGREDGPGAEASARRAISLFQSGNYGRIPEGETRARLEGYAYGNLAGALAVQFRVQEAAAAADRALQIDPGNPKAPNYEQIRQLGTVGTAGMN